ncbi:hypothetical protein [Micromonospora sp. DT31]|uniref:hypothetical protein n=1 Tax=Micromonospora sp. DT31 TaxID=3393434 RepID=UPI003CF7DEEC
MSDLPAPGSSEPPPGGDPSPPPAGWPASGQAGASGQPGPSTPGGRGPTSPPPAGWTAPGVDGSGGTPPGWSAPGGTPPGGWSGAYSGHPMPGATYPAVPVPAYPGWFPGLDPQDPLVNPPHAGIGPWFARCWGAVRRGWRQLLPIMLLTQAIPAAVISVISLFLTPTGDLSTGPDGAPVLPDGYWQNLFALYGVILAATLIFGPLQAIGWAAGTWVVTRQAAGEPTGLGAAFRYGVRRALGLWGWTLVVSLLVTLGFCLCVLPGVYAAAALALFGPVYLFERQDPIGRSWRMFHRRFGMVLGRVALVVAAVIVASLLEVVVSAVSTAAFGADPMATAGTAIGALVLALVAASLTAPASLAQQVGLVVTYAEQRAQEGPVTAGRLAAELG